MGTFEKLGILVIVMIVVMILAVAIYQWGGADPSAVSPGAVGAAATATIQDAPFQRDFIQSLTIKHGGTAATPDAKDQKGDGHGDAWTGGIPKTYVVQKNDVLSTLVVDRWGLGYAFVERMKKANPKTNFKRLMPGDTLVVPDPSAFRRGAAAPAAEKTRIYRIQPGDVLSKIAEDQLGSSRRWKEIRDLNDGLTSRNLIPGKEIRIPAR